MTYVIERLAKHQALKYINYAMVAAVLLAALLAVRGAVKLIAGPSASGTPAESADAGNASGSDSANIIKPLTYYEPAVSNNIFGIQGQRLTTITASQQEEPEPASQTDPSVKIRLMGTVAWSDASGYAFVIESGSEQKLYKRGQEIAGAGILREVHPDMVVMDLNGNIYEVELESFTDSGGQGDSVSTPRSRTRTARPRRNPSAAGKDFSQFARRTGANEFVVSKRAIDESIQNPQNVLTDARLLPNLEKGTQRGFRISEIKRGGLYENLGLRNGDVLLSVNDFQLSSPESALQAFTTLQGSSSIKLNIERRGKKIELKYNIR